MSERSTRQRRVAEQLRQVLMESMQRGDFDHPLLLNESSKVSITEVLASPDLKNATALISYFGEEDEGEIIDALNHQTRELQREINRKLTLKFTPRVTFKADRGFAHGSRIDELLSKL